MDKWIKYGGTDCYYRVEGTGKTLMLVHGFIEEGNMWNAILNELKKKHKVIIPDLPGFGRSPLLVNELSMEWYAGFLHEILKKENTQKLILLGHSMGGYITLSFAEKHGQMLTGFGLLNSHCFEDTPTKKENRLKGIAFIKEHGTHFFISELYNSIFHPTFKKKNKKLIDSLIHQAQKYNADAVMKANAAMMNRKDKSEVLKNATVPVLFINGKEDESAPLALTLKQASYPPIADFYLFDDAKHMSVFERRAEVIKFIKAFCSR